MTDEHHPTPRHARILEILRQTGFQTVSALASQTQVSDMTIRRDLRKLEEAGELRVVHGGASVPLSTALGGYERRAVSHAYAKQLIGRAAARLVAVDDTIGIDAGTTTRELAVALDESYHGTVVTCSVPVIQTLLPRRDIHLIGTGGDLVRASHAFAGPAAVESIQRLRFTAVFLGAGSADDNGLYVATDMERPTKLALIASADRVVAVVDSAKFASRAPVHLCSWDAVDALVTDTAPPVEIAHALTTAGVEVIVGESGH